MCSMPCPQVTEGSRQRLLATAAQSAVNVRPASRSGGLYSPGPEGGIPYVMKYRTHTISDSLRLTTTCTRPSRRLMICDMSSIAHRKVGVKELRFLSMELRHKRSILTQS